MCRRKSEAFPGRKKRHPHTSVTLLHHHDFHYYGDGMVAKGVWCDRLRCMCERAKPTLAAIRHLFLSLSLGKTHSNTILQLS